MITRGLSFADGNHILCLQSLRALRDGEFHLLPIFESTISIAMDGAVMNEDVIALSALDKTIPFCVVEPLDFSFFLLRHFSDLLAEPFQTANGYGNRRWAAFSFLIMKHFFEKRRGKKEKRRKKQKKKRKNRKIRERKKKMTGFFTKQEYIDGKDKKR